MFDQISNCVAILQRETVKQQNTVHLEDYTADLVDETKFLGIHENWNSCINVFFDRMIFIL